MRSRLEATFAAGLDKLGIVWQYEPRCFADETGQYLPDFEIALGDKTQCFIEVKPAFPSAFHMVWQRMEIILASLPSATLALVSPDLGSKLLISDTAEWAQRGCPQSKIRFVRAGVWTKLGPAVDSRPDALDFLFDEDLLDGHLPFDWSWQ